MNNRIKLAPKDMKAGDILCLNGQIIQSVIYCIQSDVYMILCDTASLVGLFLYPDEELYVLRSNNEEAETS